MNSNSIKLQSVVCIFSAGHDGSTLLGLMVGSHSKAFYVGELHALPAWVKKNQKCGCRSSIKECEFWRAVSNRYQHLHGLDFFAHPKKLPVYHTYNAAAWSKYIWKLQKATGYLGTAYDFLFPLEWLMRFRWQKMVRATVDLCNVVSQVSGSRIIVDSTKHYLRIYNFWREYPVLIKVIFLVRDGRAVCNSYMRNYGLSMQRSATYWRNTYVRGEKILSRVTRENRLFMKYEDICNAPEREAQKVAQFLSISFESAMSDLSRGLGHSIAGNNMKWKPNNVIKLNEKWKTDLSMEELKCFESIAGEINRRFGYPHYSHLYNTD